MELTLAGKAKEDQSWRAGSYVLANGLVNGYPHWLKLDESQAIWFDKVASSWLVSEKENLGTNTGGISGPKGKDSYPNEIKQGWRYDDGTKWADAVSSDVFFKAIGTFFKPSLYKINSVFKAALNLFKNCS